MSGREGTGVNAIQQLSAFKEDIGRFSRSGYNGFVEAGEKYVEDNNYFRIDPKLPTFDNTHSLEYILDAIDLRVARRSDHPEAPAKDRHIYDQGPRFPGFDSFALERSGLLSDEGGTFKEQHSVYNTGVKLRLSEEIENMSIPEKEYVDKTASLFLSYLEYGSLKRSIEENRSSGKDRGGYTDEDAKKIMKDYLHNIKDFSDYVSPNTPSTAVARFLAGFSGTVLPGFADRIAAMRFGLQNDEIKKLNGKIGDILISQRPSNRN